MINMVIKNYVDKAPMLPGVYRMIDSCDRILYIGKAKIIKLRLAQYLQVNNLTARIQKMLLQVNHIEFIVCSTDKDAILLEANLIKSLKPKYNILLRDDKSFPYVVLRTDHDYPQLLKVRGVKKIQGKYFGPFASTKNLYLALEELQKIFPLRTCSDAYLSNRERPCIQYEIKRCAAPCVNKISKPEYQEIVSQLENFLCGNNQKIQQNFTNKMQAASEKMEYELAAIYRDRIVALNTIQHKQYKELGITDCDFIVVFLENYQCCIEIFFFRGGQNLGNKAYFPEQIEDMSEAEILEAFITNFYQHHEAPKEIITNISIENNEIYEELFSTKIYQAKSGEKHKILNFALHNAKTSLMMQFNKSMHHQRLMTETANYFGIEEKIFRIDVFDNSHLSGTNAVSAMIVHSNNGFNKKAYRVFKFKEANTQNDYDMMIEAVKRRYSRLLKEFPNYEENEWPDLVIIDGGPGHFAVISKLFEEMGFDVPIVSIAKGEKRNAGGETFYTRNKEAFTLPNDNIVMQFIQRLRDEAHRFAITNHRKQKSKSEFTTSLDNLNFMGDARKKNLLNYFGSLSAIMDASVEELMKVKTISKELAQKIYDYYHAHQ